MPCYDPRDRVDNLHNNEAAALLCRVCRHVEALFGKGAVEHEYPYLAEWWADHQRRDTNSAEYYAGKLEDKG